MSAQRKEDFNQDSTPDLRLITRSEKPKRRVLGWLLGDWEAATTPEGRKDLRDITWQTKNMPHNR